jgi:2-dehydropantoate 2-reductase
LSNRRLPDQGAHVSLDAPRTAVVGVGAIGGVAADGLIAAGHRPLLCVRHSFDTLVVETPTGTTRRKAFDLAEDPARVQPHDLVVVATKTHQTEGAGPWLRALTGPESVVLVIQNGVEHVERVQPLAAEGALVVPAIIDVPAQRSAPGTVSVRRSGTLVLPATEGGERVVAMLARTSALESIHTDADFDRVMWKKLAVNVISGAIPTLTDRPAGVFRDAEIQRVARLIVLECLAVARTRGVDLADALADEIVAGFLESAPDAVNSMLRDRREGRLLEADSRNGAVARLGAAAGVDTPYNDLAAAILNAVNAGAEDET